MSAVAEDLMQELRGQRGRLVGDHPWAGHTGTIRTVEKTHVGWGLIVTLDPANDVPPGQECFLFEPKYWVPTRDVKPVQRRRRRRA